MSRKYFIILGLFLAAGFLFFNASSVEATSYWWSGGGDKTTWTDPLNWGSSLATNGYPGATTTDIVLIATSTAGTGAGTVKATSTLAGGVSTLTLQNGWTLILGNGATLSASSTVFVLGTSTLKLGDTTWGSGTLNLGQTDPGAPLSLPATANFDAATGTVAYIGGGTADIIVATTTFYNLTLSSTSTAATAAIRTYKFGAFAAAQVRQVATTTISNIFYVATSSKADFQGMTDLLLSGSGTPFSKTYGDFMQSSKIVYSSTSATNIATGTYANLELTGGSSVVKTLLGNTTATSTVTIPASSTLDLNGKAFTATGATWINNGTVKHDTSGSSIVHASSSHLAATSGSADTATSFDADSLPVVYVTLTDSSLNFSASTPDTLTVTVTSASAITTSQTVTLRETGDKTGIFAGGLSFTLSGTAVTGALAYQGGGTVSYSFTDSFASDSTDIGSGSATFTGTTSGGSSSGGGTTAATTVTTETTQTTTTTAAPTTSVVTTTPTVTAVSTLESVQTKVAAVIAKIAALPATPTASDLTSIQAEIAAILIELQSIQAAQPTPQGVALGFNFVRPLALGLRHADVSNLQNALKTDSSVYPEGLVTGYFGSMTLKAVQKFQEKYGIASSGQLGYGNVGPATRAKLNELFGSK